MDSPNQKQTRFLKLRYLDPSQAQPEVKINEAWDILDEAIENGLPINTGGGSSSGGGSGGGSVTVIGTGSPDEVIDDVTILRFIGGRVEAGTGPIADIFIPTELTSAELAALVLAGTALQPGSVQSIQSAGWNSPTGALLTSLAVPQDLIIPYACTLREVYILTQGGVGSCTVGIGKCAIGGFPSFADITGGTPPAIASSSTAYDNSTLTGWTKAFAANDVLRLSLTAVSNFTSVKALLRMY